MNFFKKKKKMHGKKKGFTLIELLAVIIILAIILMIAVIGVTRYIVESRKSIYATNA